MPQQPVIMMFCYFRSGGTVLNQCLGSLPDVVMMSEVNPLGGGTGASVNSPRTIRDQAREWYNIQLRHADYCLSALELNEICARSHQHLIIRDWCYLNFGPENAPMKLLGYEQLKQHITIRPFAMVRNAIDIFLSAKSHELEPFSLSYLNYVKQLKYYDIPVLKYEDFCKTPSTIIRQICDITGLTYSDSFYDYEKFTSVNGDVQFQGMSRGAQKHKIRPLPRKFASPETIEQLENCRYLVEANSILGYSSCYADAYAHEDSKTEQMRTLKVLFTNPQAIIKRLYYKFYYQIHDTGHQQKKAG